MTQNTTRKGLPLLVNLFAQPTSHSSDDADEYHDHVTREERRSYAPDSPSIPEGIVPFLQMRHIEHRTTH